MALALNRLGKFEDALNINKAVFEKRKKMLSVRHPTTLSAQNNIAMVLCNQGKYEEALKIYGKVHATRKIDPARKYAKEAITKQKEAFQSWGVMGDWKESGCYFTNRPSYIKNQLQQFMNLYEKGIVFRDFMPVFWSPSSR